MVLIKSGVIIIGALPLATGLAAEVMTGMLLCTIFAAGYALGIKRYLRWWGVMTVIPVIALTRAAIVATGLTLPFTFGPMRMVKRVIILVVICFLGVMLLYTPRVQNKMFLQGQGQMSDILDGNFADSGRFAMWEHFKLGIGDEPWFGHGVGAGEILARVITFNLSGYPHNDWLLTLYDYGFFGTIIYALSLIVASLHAFRNAAFASKSGRMLFLAGAASFIPFAMLMYTDNIMVYVSFFGNLQFTILGIAYASLNENKPETA
jgi:O-antigen ligase